MQTAYEFAKTVDLEIGKLTQEEYLCHSGQGKLLLEEWYPIARLGLHLKRAGLEVGVEAFDDKRVADGHIIESGFRNREFDIQVTYVYDYEEELRRELMVKQGYSPGAGLISREKKSREILATVTAVDFDHNLIVTAAAIAQRFAEKALKTYPSDTALIIAFDDITLSGVGFWGKLLALIANDVCLKESRFESVFIVNCATNELIQAV